MESDSQYSLLVGMAYLFNTMFGTGILALPRAFASGGWLVSTVTLLSSVALSYVTVTFLIEVIACACGKTAGSEETREGKERITPADMVKENIAMADKNAGADEWKERKALIEEPDGCVCCRSGSESDLCPSVFDINKTISFTDLTAMYFNPVGDILSRIVLLLSIWGSLLMYLTMVPFSLANLLCKPETDCNKLGNFSFIADEGLCWGPLTKISVYRIFLTLFILLVGPFVFFSVQKNKYIQVFASIMSFVVFSIMFVTSVVILARGRGRGTPILADFNAFPSVFGACSVAAVSHTVLPTVVPLIRNKTYLCQGVMVVFATVTLLYLTLCVFVVFVFPEKDIQAVILVNFATCSVVPVVFVIYILGLYTTIKVSANFPLNGVTLSDNLKSMFAGFQCSHAWPVDRLLFPLAVIAPPLAISYGTHNIEMIVGITGSYTVNLIQYVTPSALVYLSRKEARARFGDDVLIKHASPFQHGFWIILALLYAAVGLVVSTVFYVKSLA
ncbi:transmembrane protein 104-like isoform X2 [Acipenser ruthenus]|uniref:transmembrane protein 104-like isoform X2 n=1 Tax=Acipenser ruthenus TaxID=7906 RepID=UPI00145AA1DB|nr:transmembrane protein 104-like isoform X2 [Acipenser ruthenus]